MELNYQYRAADMVGDAGGFWTVVTAAWVAALLPFALFLHSIELLSNGEAGKDHDHPSKPLSPRLHHSAPTEERFQLRSGERLLLRELFKTLLEQNALRSTQTEEQRRAMLHAFGLELARPPTKLSPTVTNNAIEFNSEL